jgi:holo-[acyl-carrier protein] synthase
MIGIGIDVVEIKRIEDAYFKYENLFLNRIFTEKERLHAFKFKNFIEKLAGKFAAKEAVSKAFGTGIGKIIYWKDIEVLHKPSGQPYVNLYNRAVELFKKFNGKEIFVSITDIKDLAVAVVVIE